MQKKFLTLLILFVSACTISTPVPQISPQQAVPHEEKWGVYRLAIDTQAIALIYSSPNEIASLRLNSVGDKFVFSQKVGGDNGTHEEIFTMGLDGKNLQRITKNDFWDLYPVWSPDGSKIVFLSKRLSSLGIYIMDADGSNVKSLYDSNDNEADIDWRGNQIVFTRNSSIWIMQSDGINAHPITHPPKVGLWGKANLPFGDYDPRLSPDGSRVVFERLVDDQSSHGNYDFFILDTSKFNEFQLTYSGYSQGLASWSNSGDQIVYIVAAIDNIGQYDLYLMNADGTENRNFTPQYFPPQFLCQWAIFSKDDSAIYFIGEWWTTK